LGGLLECVWRVTTQGVRLERLHLIWKEVDCGAADHDKRLGVLTSETQGLYMLGRLKEVPLAREG
jgi:hypothetical protein